MSVRSFVTAMLVGSAVVVVSAGVGVAAQKPQAQQPAAMAKAVPQPDMAAKRKATMAEMDTMMAEVKTADDGLNDLVAKMNAAAGMEKTDAIAAVVNEMVRQRRAMRDGMMKMQEDIMGHMMEHMQAGKDSMAMCPMMKHIVTPAHAVSPSVL